ETLHNSDETQFGADLMTGDLESFKSAVHAALEQLDRPEESSVTGGVVAPRPDLLYLICDKRDRTATVPLRKFLRSRGIDVQTPVMEGDAATVRRHNQQLLTRCDAIVVFYGAGDESWKRTVDSDLRKMKGYRGEYPLRAAYTYLAAPVTDDKNDLIEMEEANLMNGLNGFSEPDVEPLINVLRGV